MLDIGSPAPQFSVMDQTGRLVCLDDLRGQWVVLYFYPKDDTPGCTVEACEFTEQLPEFTGLQAVVYGCSPDDPESHARFIQKHGLTIQLLSDPDLSMMKAYGAYGEKTRYGKKVIGVLRSTVLIDPQGRVAHHWPTVRAEGHAEKVRTRLAALQGVEDSITSKAMRAGRELAKVAQDVLQQLKQDVEEKAQWVRKDVEQKVRRVRKDLEQKAQRVKTNVEQMAQQVKEGVAQNVRKLQKKVAGTAQSAKKNVVKKAQGAKKNVARKMQRVQKSVVQRAKKVQRRGARKLQKVLKKVATKKTAKKPSTGRAAPVRKKKVVRNTGKKARKVAKKANRRTPRRGS